MTWSLTAWWCCLVFTKLASSKRNLTDVSKVTYKVYMCKVYANVTYCLVVLLV